MSKPTLIVCGSIALDRIMNFSGTYTDLIKPDKLHVLSVSVLLDKMEETPGGTAANITYDIACLGEQPVLLGSIGHDGAEYLERLKNTGVNVDAVHTSDLPTASFNVMTDSDDNQVGGFYPGAMGDAASLTLEPWHDQDVVVCISSHHPPTMNSQVAECKESGLRLVYDPGQQVSNSPPEYLKAGVDAAEVLILNDYELGVVSDKTGESPEAIKARVPIVITTLGKKGSIIEGTQMPEAIEIPIAKAAQVVDPTGAGDAYRAGFLYGYLRQWQLPACGRLGAVVASFIIEHHGTQVKLSKADIIKRYQETYNEEITL